MKHQTGTRMQRVDALSRSFDVFLVGDNSFEYNLSV